MHTAPLAAGPGWHNAHSPAAAGPHLGRVVGEGIEVDVHGVLVEGEVVHVHRRHHEGVQAAHIAHRAVRRHACVGLDHARDLEEGGGECKCGPQTSTRPAPS